MPSNCCAPNCTHSGSSHKSIKCRMKRFPRDRERAALWEANIRSAGRKDWVRKSWHALCECHFDKNQWENRLDGLKKLRPNAVPSIFFTFPNAEIIAEEKRRQPSVTHVTPTHKFQEDLQTMHSCCAVMCYHTSKTCKLKKFPSDLKRAKVWQMNIGRPGWERNSMSFVCECHFDEEQFEANTTDGVRKLRTDAVPLIFPTHVLVVHDPSSKKKWHSPKARAPDDWNRSSGELEQPVIEIDVDEDDYGGCPEAYGGMDNNDKPNLNGKMKNDDQPSVNRRMSSEDCSFITDHQYSKDAIYMLDSEDNSQMCKNFCSVDDLKEIENLAESISGESDEVENPDLESVAEDCYQDMETLHQVDNSSNGDKSPCQGIKDTDVFNNGERANDSIGVNLTQNSYLHETSGAGRQSNTAKELPVEIVATPDIWSPFDVDSSVLSCLSSESSVTSPQLLKDALSFLQFMLPQKWMAVSEEGGIHAFLLSRTRAKSIQRSIFVPLTGGEVELYVHAVRLPSDHDIFQFISLIEPLTRDSLGDFVDSVINVVQLFVSYKICCGVTQKQLLKEWRKYNDCVLDSNLFGEDGYFQTVRSKKCSFFSSNDCERCDNCDSLYQRYLLVKEIC